MLIQFRISILAAGFLTLILSALFPTPAAAQVGPASLPGSKTLLVEQATMSDSPCYRHSRVSARHP